MTVLMLFRIHDLQNRKRTENLKNSLSFFLDEALHLKTQIHVVKCFAFAKREIMCDAHCEISRFARCEMKFAHVRIANISHLRSKYFTAKRFHLPGRANFVGAVSLTELRQFSSFFCYSVDLFSLKRNIPTVREISVKISQMMPPMAPSPIWILNDSQDTESPYFHAR